VDCENPSSDLPGFHSPSTRKASAIDQCRDMVIARKEPDLAIKISESTYERRAWTFQEHLLSTRVYFTKEQVYSHCRTELRSEDHCEHSKHTDPLRNYPSHMAIAVPIQNLLPRLVGWGLGLSSGKDECGEGLGD